MSKLKTLLLALACGLVVIGCGDDDDDGGTEPTALIRVVHNSPDAPNVDVRFNDDEVLADVPYLASSGYLEVPTGPANLKVLVTGTETIAIEEDVVLDADTAYTVIATNLVADIAAMILIDNIEPPADGETRVRLIHGAVSAPPVDIFVTGPEDPLGEPALTNVPYMAVADNNVLPAGTYRVRIAPTGTTDVVIDSGAVPLESGVPYTAIAVDAVGGGAPFGAILLVDEPPAE